MTTFLFDFSPDNGPVETICVPDCDERTARILIRADHTSTDEVLELPVVTLTAAPNSTARTWLGLFRVSRISNVRATS